VSNSNSNNIKIPVGLALQVLDSKTTRKALDTYFRLKSIADNGWIYNSVKQLTSLEKELKICYKTLKKRLEILSKMDLVVIQKTHITIASYKQLNKKYTTYGGHYLIKKELLQAIKLEDYLIALALKEKKEECSIAFYQKHTRYDSDKEIIKGVFNGKKPQSSYKKAVVKAHLTDYLTNGNKGDYSYIFNAARADVEIGYRKLSKMLGYKGKGSLAYTKRKLQSAGIVNINKRVVSFKTSTHSTKLSRKTNLGTINYDPRSKKLKLQLPDEIVINNQTQIISYANR
jgi:hypothetical protein